MYLIISEILHFCLTTKCHCRYCILINKWGKVQNAVNKRVRKYLKTGWTRGCCKLPRKPVENVKKNYGPWLKWISCYNVDKHLIDTSTYSVSKKLLIILTCIYGIPCIMYNKGEKNWAIFIFKNFWLVHQWGGGGGIVLTHKR